MDAGCAYAPRVRSANPSDSWALVIDYSQLYLHCIIVVEHYTLAWEWIMNGYASSNDTIACYYYIKVSVSSGSSAQTMSYLSFVAPSGTRTI